MSNDKKVALVTGGNRGIGFELVKQLAQDGFKAIIASRNSENGSTSTEKLKKIDLDVSYVVMDISNPDSIDQAITEVIEKYGRIDVLINNAGILLQQDNKLINMDRSILEKTMKTNFFGAYHVLHATIPFMERQGYGRIINISSEYGALSAMRSSGVSSYKLSKLALNGLTQLVASELKGDIKINAVDPGWVSTDMGGSSASKTPKEAAESILWLTKTGSDGPNGGFFREGSRVEW